MAERDDIPANPLDELEQRIAAKMLRSVLAILGSLLVGAVAFGSFLTKQDIRMDSLETRMTNRETKDKADEDFKQSTTAKLDVLDERSVATTKAIDRMDNKLDRVIRVYDVPK